MMLNVVCMLYVGVIRVCGTTELEENSSRNTEFWHLLDGTAESNLLKLTRTADFN